MHHGLRQLGFGHHPNEKENVRNATRLRQFFSRFHPVSRHESKGCNPLLRALHSVIDQLEACLLVHENSAVPALAKEGGLVLPNENHDRVDTREAPPFQANVAPVQAESRCCSARRAFPIERLLWRGLHHHASVSVWTKRAFDLDWSFPC